MSDIDDFIKIKSIKLYNDIIRTNLLYQNVNEKISNLTSELEKLNKEAVTIRIQKSDFDQKKKKLRKTLKSKNIDDIDFKEIFPGYVDRTNFNEIKKIATIDFNPKFSDITFKSDSCEFIDDDVLYKYNFDNNILTYNSDYYQYSDLISNSLDEVYSLKMVDPLFGAHRLEYLVGGRDIVLPSSSIYPKFIFIIDDDNIGYIYINKLIIWNLLGEDTIEYKIEEFTDCIEMRYKNGFLYYRFREEPNKIIIRNIENFDRRNIENFDRRKGINIRSPNLISFQVLSNDELLLWNLEGYEKYILTLYDRKTKKTKKFTLNEGGEKRLYINFNDEIYIYGDKSIYKVV